MTHLNAVMLARRGSRDGGASASGEGGGGRDKSQRRESQSKDSDAWEGLVFFLDLLGHENEHRRRMAVMALGLGASVLLWCCCGVAMVLLWCCCWNGVCCSVVMNVLASASAPVNLVLLVLA